MNFKRFFLCAFILSTINSFSFAQEEPTIDVTKVTKATFLNPGISYENRVGKYQTMYLQAFMQTSAYFSYSSSFGTSSGIYFDPALTAQYRYYYNGSRRQEKGKRTELNSMNYLGAVWETFFSKNAMAESSIDEENRRPVHSFGLVWGLQRNYQSRFSLDFNIGYGFLFTKGTELNESNEFKKVNQFEFTSVGQLNLGFWLNRRN
jgi:hypothetical protein